VEIGAAGNGALLLVADLVDLLLLAAGSRCNLVSDLGRLFAHIERYGWIAARPWRTRSALWKPERRSRSRVIVLDPPVSASLQEPPNN